MSQTRRITWSTSTHTSAYVSIRRRRRQHTSARHTACACPRHVLSPAGRAHIRQHTSQATSACVSIRRITERWRILEALRKSAYVSISRIRQHTSAYVASPSAGASSRLSGGYASAVSPAACRASKARASPSASAANSSASFVLHRSRVPTVASSVSIRQHSSAYVSIHRSRVPTVASSVRIRPHTSAYVSIRQHRSRQSTTCFLKRLV